MKIKLHNMGDLIDFVCGIKFYNGLILVEEDGKKIEFVKRKFSVESFTEPFVVTIDTDNRREKDDFYDFISKWKVEE